MPCICVFVCLWFGVLFALLPRLHDEATRMRAHYLHLYSAVYVHIFRTLISHKSVTTRRARAPVWRKVRNYQSPATHSHAHTSAPPPPPPSPWTNNFSLVLCASPSCLSPSSSNVLVCRPCALLNAVASVSGSYAMAQILLYAPCHAKQAQDACVHRTTRPSRAYAEQQQLLCCAQT